MGKFGWRYRVEMKRRERRRAKRAAWVLDVVAAFRHIAAETRRECLQSPIIVRWTAIGKVKEWRRG